ncbi:hypothetical protein M2251_000111 [Rhodococcus erythropolis]|nr:hypothetical protein [Rhodococcus erythropolis]
MGILLCAGRNDNVVRYSLAGTTAPLAVADYTYETPNCPSNLTTPAERRHSILEPGRHILWCRDPYRCFARGSANAMPGPARCVEGQGRQFYVQSMWTDSMESK